jgi:hypothetical protein
MNLLSTLVRRSFGWVLGLVESIRHGEDDTRERPGDASPGQRLLQGSVGSTPSRNGGRH